MTEKEKQQKIRKLMNSKPKLDNSNVAVPDATNRTGLPQTVLKTNRAYSKPVMGSKPKPKQKPSTRLQPRKKRLPTTSKPSFGKPIAQMDSTLPYTLKVWDKLNLDNETRVAEASTYKERAKALNASENTKVALLRAMQVNNRGYDVTSEEKKQQAIDDKQRAERHKFSESIASDYLINKPELDLLWDANAVEDANRKKMFTMDNFITPLGYYSMLEGMNPRTQGEQINLIFLDANSNNRLINSTQLLTSAVSSPATFAASTVGMVAGNKLGSKATDLIVKWTTPYNSWSEYAKNKWGYTDEEANMSNPGGLIGGTAGAFGGPLTLSGLSKLSSYRLNVPMNQNYYYRQGTGLIKDALNSGVIRTGVNPLTGRQEFTYPYFNKGRLHYGNGHEYEVIVNKGKGNYHWEGLNGADKIVPGGKSVVSAYNGKGSMVVDFGFRTPLVKGQPNMASAADFEAYKPINTSILGKKFNLGYKKISLDGKPSGLNLDYDAGQMTAPFILSGKYYENKDDEDKTQQFKNGKKIHIKESLKGSFTRYCGGNVTSECIARGKASPDPRIRKKATFAANARKWNHQEGGELTYKSSFEDLKNAKVDPEALDPYGRFTYGLEYNDLINNEKLNSIIK